MKRQIFYRFRLCAESSKATITWDWQVMLYRVCMGGVIHFIWLRNLSRTDTAEEPSCSVCLAEDLAHTVGAILLGTAEGFFLSSSLVICILRTAQSSQLTFVLDMRCLTCETCLKKDQEVVPIKQIQFMWTPSPLAVGIVKEHQQGQQEDLTDPVLAAK